ncbi:MAG: hypothetical protein JO279_05955 [Verrucomicrobia bacterium]|nr:hypothetical protein [Verrucomicrobiota bacterium]
MGLLERMTECVTGTAFISRSETAAVGSNTGETNEIDRLGISRVIRQCMFLAGDRTNPEEGDPAD